MRKKRQQIQINTKYHKLTIIDFSHKDKRWRSFYHTLCECGNKKTIMGSAIISGNTKSCGCLHRNKTDKKLPDNLGVKRQIILGYKRHAKERNISFEMSEDDFIFLLDKPCYYCNTLPSNLKITKNCKSGFYYSGIDRMDSKLGYTKENCVSCCAQCNKSKMASDKNTFLQWIERVYNHSIKITL
jgi:hypothetical protein